MDKTVEAAECILLAEKMQGFTCQNTIDSSACQYWVKSVETFFVKLKELNRCSGIKLPLSFSLCLAIPIESLCITGEEDQFLAL